MHNIQAALNKILRTKYMKTKLRLNKIQKKYCERVECLFSKYYLHNINVLSTVYDSSFISEYTRGGGWAVYGQEQFENCSCFWPTQFTFNFFGGRKKKPIELYGNCFTVYDPYNSACMRIYIFEKLKIAQQYYQSENNNNRNN